MKLQPAAYLRTTLPLAVDAVGEWDTGRYHSLWLPDHMVSFWPDSIWTPEFTELALSSHSPHRHLDAMSVASFVAAKTSRVPIVTTVADTIRRHPAMLAQTALTLSHLSSGRFILGLGSGEMENTVPYGFDFRRPVGRFEEAIKVIKLLWESDGPVSFEGQFFHLENARIYTEPFNGTFPPIWMGAGGPRSLKIAGEQADGWFCTGGLRAEDFAARYRTLCEAADAVGRDPAAIVPAKIQVCLIGDQGFLDEVLEKPMVKAVVLILSSADLRAFGHSHPMGPDWSGIHDFDPAKLSREVALDFVDQIDPQLIRDIYPVGTPQEVARKLKGWVDAGMRVFKILDYSTMAGPKYAAGSAQRVRETEDALLKLAGED